MPDVGALAGLSARADIPVSVFSIAVFITHLMNVVVFRLELDPGPPAAPGPAPSRVQCPCYRLSELGGCACDGVCRLSLLLVE